MKNFFIVTNLIKDPMQETTGFILDYLRSRGASADVLIRDVISKSEKDGARDRNRLSIPRDTECILVLGGDGTLLQTARDTLDLDIPLLGVNLGTLGFLAEVEKGNLTDALDHLLTDDFEVEKRMLLTGSAWHNGEKLCDAHALNDIVVSRRGPLMVLPIKVLVNGQELARYQADGVIVSTPTGSTGYNLSAGGPIVNPRAELMVVTPVCPHTINTRSVVLSSQDEIEIIVGDQLPDKQSDQQADASFDGSVFASLVSGDSIKIKRSSRTVSLIRISRMSFLRMLHQKMG